MRSLAFVLLFMAAQGLAAAKGSVYDFTLQSLGGKPLPLAAYKDKVVLIVNTASHCGYTKQFGGLERLYKANKDEGLVILGIPSGSFKQEFKDDAEIANFCKFNYGVTFPMAKILELKGKDQHPLFTYLVGASPAGEAGEVQWNFEKFLFDRKGQLVARYRSAVSPEDPAVLNKIKELLAEKVVKG